MDADGLFNVTGVVNSTRSVVLDFFCREHFEVAMAVYILCLPVACMGVTASAWLLWVLVERQRANKTNDIYMINLTVMDLIYSTCTIPFKLNYLLWQNRSLVSAAMFFKGFGMTGRPLVMACICIDCYLAVVHPITYLRLKQTRYRQVSCALVWLSVCVFYLTFDPQRSELPISTFPCLLAVLAIAICDLAILRALRKPDPSGRSEVHPQKQRAMQTITNSFVVTMVSYLAPLLILAISPLIPLSAQEKLCYVKKPTLFASTLGSVVMPLLYLGNMGKLKPLWEYVGKVFCGGCCGADR